MSSGDSSPRRVLAYVGTHGGFLDYLRSWHAEELFGRSTLAGEIYEWHLTASIAAHPAGKAIGFCCSMASDFASSGVRHSDDCPRRGVTT